jgi:ABC-type lipoprotein export system ATPase subunit
MNSPSIILADEPTGNLDSDSGTQVLNLLRRINREQGSSFIIVTHDRHIASQCDRVIEIADGKILNDITVKERPPEETWKGLAPCYCRLRQQQERN